MTKLKTQERITVLYFMRAGYMNAYICSASISEAMDRLLAKTGCKALGGKSRPSRTTGMDFIIPLN
jgi:hypothetical protein